MDDAPDYSQWSSTKLIERVTFLEQQLREQTVKFAAASALQPKPLMSHKRKSLTASKREFDPLKYSTRFIALKFAYVGQGYNGLEYHNNNPTPLPTVEEELWKALMKARLIFPTSDPSGSDREVNWEGCKYSKCGRTDKGVSAFGQVIGLRVRSNRRPEMIPVNTAEEANQNTESGDSTTAGVFDPISDELPYAQILNRILPPDIRVLAWCPSPPTDFSARFSCTERRYRYYFTQPAFSPSFGVSRHIRSTSEGERQEGWLDIEAMRNAARRFEGLHDFRNFCKIDASKQIDNFDRRIYFADVQEVEIGEDGPVGYINMRGTHSFREYKTQEAPTSGDKISHDHPQSSLDQASPKLYMFRLHGSAFLWHQVRHMVAILFLIGQGLESPSLIDTLLNVKQCPQKPTYEMADDAPLVLEDCIFSHTRDKSGPDVLNWVYVGDQLEQRGKDSNGSGKGDGKYGLGGVVDELWKVWRSRKMDEILAGTLLDVAVRGNRGSLYRQQVETRTESTIQIQNDSQKVFQGGDTYRLVGKYIPVLDRPRMDTVDVINARYAKKRRTSSNTDP
ncbi:MAG: hypothetical protein Q9190_007955 [Brigantiaea leucoxantha]